ncbi:MAG: hypothetical protein RMI91_00380 [Gemmatales bacterium]|nr:hypothetical protein [Gemmatales bacterium]MDW7993087.1 hypothetical protein [Gemmatales bacterium]
MSEATDQLMVWPSIAQRLVVESLDSGVHRVLAVCGPYRLIHVLNAATVEEPVGVTFLAHSAAEDFPVWQSPGQDRSDLAPETVHREALALGPLYREADGAWLPLAGLPATWFDATLEVLRENGESLSWATESKVYGGPILLESLTLTPQALDYSCGLRWTIPGFALQLPLWLTDGQRSARPQLQGPELRVHTPVWTLVAECLEPEDASWSLDTSSVSRGTVQYARALLQSRAAVCYRVRLRVTCP